MSVAVILGSAFDAQLDFVPRTVETPFGDVVLHEAPRGFALFRHGVPHRYLPHQIPFRAHTWALHHVGVKALLVTSSCGVLDRAVPLDTPLIVDDIVMLDNRLPDGSACTMWPEPHPDQGHLVVGAGLLDAALSAQLGDLPRVLFAYNTGPRTKTRAENRIWRSLGVQVNSMTLGPEVVLANELGIATAAVAVGHKYSLPDEAGPDRGDIDGQLERGRVAFTTLVQTFLAKATPVPFANSLYRFHER